MFSRSRTRFSMVLMNAAGTSKVFFCVSARTSSSMIIRLTFSKSFPFQSAYFCSESIWPVLVHFVSLSILRDLVKNTLLFVVFTWIFFLRSNDGSKNVAPSLANMFWTGSSFRRIQTHSPLALLLKRFSMRFLPEYVLPRPLDPTAKNNWYVGKCPRTYWLEYQSLLVKLGLIIRNCFFMLASYGDTKSSIDVLHSDSSGVNGFII